MDTIAPTGIRTPAKPLETARERGLRWLFGGYRSAVADRLEGSVKSSWRAGKPIIPVLPLTTLKNMLGQGLDAPGRRVAVAPEGGFSEAAAATVAAAEAAGLKPLVLVTAAARNEGWPGKVVEIPDPAFIAARLQYEAVPDPFDPDPQPKRRRLLISLHDPHDQARWTARAKEVTYLEFLRWEMAEWLDREHPKFMVRGFPLRSGVRSDDNRATLDTIMLMRHYNHARSLDVPPSLDAIVAAMGAFNPMLVTTQPSLALFGVSRQLPTIFVPLTTAEGETFRALGLGAMTTEPYRFRADLASEMIVAVHNSSQARQEIATARKALAAQAETAQRQIAEWLQEGSA